MPPLVYALHAAAVLERDPPAPPKSADPPIVPAPAPAAAVDPSGEVAALRLQVEVLVAELNSERAARRRETAIRDAETFVAALVRDRRYPADAHATLVALYVQAALDDHDNPVSGVGRVDNLRAMWGRQTPRPVDRADLRVVNGSAGPVVELPTDAFVIGGGWGE